jgi:hypothetical protein
MEDLLVDARWLEPPEPLERTLEALERLLPQQKLRLLIHRDPIMLYSILRDWGYTWQTESKDDGSFEIMIWREPKVWREPESNGS